MTDSTVRPGARRSRERFDERQRQIVDIAAGVFAERGFHATSIEDLVKATGLQRGGLYHYIDSKKALLVRIHERFIDPLLQDAQRIVELGEGPEETLRLVARALMSDIAAYRDQVTVFLHEWRMIETDPEWAGVRRSRKAFERLVGDVLERGEREGVFVIAEPRLALLGFLGMFNYSYQWYRPGGPDSPEEIAEALCAFYVEGIRR